MRHVWSVFALVTLLLISCTCGGPIQNIDVPLVTEPPNIELLTYGRENHREFMAHITNRTVAVYRDCTTKKNVVVVGVDKPNKALDTRGTGALIETRKGKSYIYTAAHVVESIDKKYKKGYTCKLFIYRNDEIGITEKRITARILAINIPRDIAVLVVDKDLGFISASEPNVFTGEHVWTAGYSFQPTAPKITILSIASGEVATVNIPRLDDPNKYGHYHRVTAPAYFGSSGGGTWNSEGKIVGIFVSLLIHKKTVPFDGFYYVKPIKEFEDLLRENWKYWEVFGYPDENIVETNLVF